MNSREHLVKCFKDERPKFLRVLRAVPPDQLAYRPHPRSTCTGDLVWLLASELGDACEIADHGEVNFVQTPAPKTLEESIAAYERNSSELEKRLSRLDDAHVKTSAPIRQQPYRNDRFIAVTSIKPEVMPAKPR